MLSFGWRRLGYGICAGAALAGALLVAVVFLTALPERLAREPLLAFLERRYGLVATVDRLDLDFARLRVAATGLELAASGRTDEPFLTVAEALVDLPWSAVRDGIAVDELRLERPVVSVVRRADGSSNLPGGGASVDAAPAGRLPIRRLDVRGLAVDWRDDAAGLAFHLPAMAVGWGDAGSGSAVGASALQGRREPGAGRRAPRRPRGTASRTSRERPASPGAAAPRPKRLGSRAASDTTAARCG